MDMFAKYDLHATLLKAAYEAGLLQYSSDAVKEKNGKGLWVPVEKLESFIDFVVKVQPNDSINPGKPYVGKLFRLARGLVYATPENSYKQQFNTMDLFPEYVLIVDEKRGNLCVIGNDNCKYWFRRSAFGKQPKK